MCAQLPKNSFLFHLCLHLPAIIVMSNETEIQPPADINPKATTVFEIPHPLEQIDLIASIISVIGNKLAI